MLTQKYNFNVVRLLRKNKNLTLKELASKAGMNYAILSRLERNQANITFQTLVKLANALEIPPHRLIEISRTQRPEVKRLKKSPGAGGKTTYTNFQKLKLSYVKMEKPEVVANPSMHGNEYEMLIILKGKVEVDIEGKTHTVKEGEAIYFDATCPHNYNIPVKTEMVFIYYPKQEQ